MSSKSKSRPRTRSHKAGGTQQQGTVGQIANQGGDGSDQSLQTSAPMTGGANRAGDSMTAAAPVRKRKRTSGGQKRSRSRTRSTTTRGTATRPGATEVARPSQHTSGPIIDQTLRNNYGGSGIFGMQEMHFRAAPWDGSESLVVYEQRVLGLAQEAVKGYVQQANAIARAMTPVH